MIDLNSGSGANPASLTFSDRVNAVIDAGILARRAKEPPRDYLGASLIGHPCMRYLVYVYSKTPPDRDFDARTLRIFDVGHGMEDMVTGEDSDQDKVYKLAATRWFRDAGFDLRSRAKDGKQFGWEALDGKLQGHIDGVLVAGPQIPGLIYPAIHEIKAVNRKSWNKFKKHGVKISSDLYFGQSQTNMGYLETGQTVFTVVNKDTEELHHEIVELDLARAQILSDRALDVIRAKEGGYLPSRIATNSDFYLCHPRMCSYAGRCWKVDS